MSEFSQLHGILDAARLSAVRKILADVCDEENVDSGDVELRQAMAEGVLAVIGGGRVDTDKIRAAALAAIHDEQARQAMLPRTKAMTKRSRSQTEGESA